MRGDRFALSLLVGLPAPDKHVHPGLTKGQSSTLRAASSLRRNAPKAQ